MIVVFSGNDGSGKSTLSKLFYQKIKEERRCKVKYRRGFEYFLLKYILKLFPQAGLEDTRDVFLDTKIKNKGWFYKLSGMVWPAAVWLDYFFYYFYAQAAERKNIVIFDRFVLDSLVGWEYFGYGNAFIRWLYLVFPRPGLVFLLDAPGELTFRRSGADHKFPLEFYIAQRDRYLRYAAAKDIKVVSTEQPVEFSLKEIMEWWKLKTRS